MQEHSLSARKVYLFGAMHIEDQHGAIALPSGNTQTLFAYLVLSPGKHSREHLADLFWPDAPPDRTGRYFSNLIYRLRQSLGEAWLEILDEHIALQTGQGLWVDVMEFEASFDRGNLNAIQQALALYQGDLLPEIYADWILPRRVALREKYLSALSRLAQAAEADHDIDKAFNHYHRLSSEDPLNEAACRGLMRIYTRMDRPAAAQAEYERLRVLLNDELGVAPVAETRALAESIQGDYEARRAGKTYHPAYVGRRQERAALLRAVDKASQGHGGLVLVEGEPGVGKTRLLETVAEGASWRGVTVAWGKATEFSAATPYAPLDEALQNVISGSRAAHLNARLSPVVFDALVAIAPGIGGRRPTTHSALQSSTAPPDLPAALQKVLTALAEIVPLVIILDDVQWAGPAFWKLLSFATHLNHSAVLIILSYRSEALRTDPTAWLALQDIDLKIAPLRLNLSGLEKNACDDLARELGHTLSPEQLEAFHAITRGNPLYIQEALVAQPAFNRLPPSLTRLFERRFAALSSAGRSAVEIAAVLGREFSHGVWQAAGGRDIVAAIPELLASRLIEETPHSYQFQHDLTRQQVYQAIEADRLRRLHLQIANVLSVEHAVPEVLAWHYEQGAAWELAVRYHRLAGDRAAQAYAYQAALEHYEQGVALLTHLPDVPGERLALLLHRQRVLRLLAHLGALRSDVEEIERLASRLGDTAAMLEALEVRIRLTNIDSDMLALRENIARAVAMATEAGDPALEARLLNTAGFYLADALGEHSAALPLLRRSVELAEATRDSPLVIEALCNLAFVLWATGSCQSAHEKAAHALAVAELRPGHLPARAHALASLGQVAMGLGQWEQAYNSLQKAVQQYEELSDHWNIGDTLYNFAIAASEMGQHAEAVQTAKRLLTLTHQAGIPPDSSVSVWYHGVGLRVYTAAGDFNAARRMCSTIESKIGSMGNSRALIIALTALGNYYLAAGHLPKAVERLERAFRLWQPAQNLGDVRCALLYAVAAHRSGDYPAAQASLALAEAVLAKSDVRFYRVAYEYTRFIVLGDQTSMVAAKAEIQSQAAAIENIAFRRSFLTEVGLHREIEAEIERLSIGAAKPVEIPGSQVVLLARRDAPLGKALTDAEKVAVRWTVDAGEADAAILRQHGKTALRRQRIRRLLSDAYQQGASPTDADLARALNVTRRTILRDMVVLQTSGEALPTRRRKG